MESPSIAMLAEEANKYRITIIGGSIPEMYNGNVFNTSTVIAWNRGTITKHQKCHLFDVDIPGGIHFHESETLTPGPITVSLSFHRKRLDGLRLLFRTEDRPGSMLRYPFPGISVHSRTIS